MLKNKIALVNQWPNQPNAEREVVARVKLSAAALGIETIVVDKLGYDLDTSKEITEDDVDFVIHFHFETPKCYNVYSYVALWNPLDFYFQWGYHKHSQNLVTHDDFLSCSSPWADDHINRLIFNDGGHLPPAFKLHHTLSETTVEPKLLDNPKIFYCGINWEKIGGHKGRFEQILKLLDRKDMISIYGPEKVRGVKVWAGFKSYKKSIPFDGKTSIEEIAKCGIAFVFSSDAHKQSGLMSNRLFESAAAGAIIIADDNPFARAHFGNALLYVNTQTNHIKTTEQIITHYNWIKQNPEKALALAKKTQAIFLDKFCLRKELKHIMDHHMERKAKLEQLYTAKTQDNKINLIHVLHEPSQGIINELLDSLNRQTYKNFELTLYLNGALKKQFIFNKANFNLTIIPIRLTNKKRQVILSTGQIVRKQLAENTDDNCLVHVSTGEARFFSQHLSALIKQFESNKEANIVFSDLLLKCLDKKNIESRVLLQTRNIIDLKINVQSVQIPFIFKAKLFSCAERFFTDYLDDLLSAFLMLEAYSTSAKNICYNRRATALITLTRPLSLLDKDNQIDIVQDKYSDAFINNAILNLPSTIKKLDLRSKQALAEEMLKNIPLHHYLRKIFKKVYLLIKPKKKEVA